MQYPGLKIERLCVGLPRPECRAMPPMGAADCRLARSLLRDGLPCCRMLFRHVRRVACCALCGAGCAVLWGRSALAAWCCALRVVGRVSVSFAGLSLFIVRRGAVWWRGAAWCCPVCRFAPLVLVYCLRLQLCASCSATLCLLCHLSYCVHWLPPVILSDSIRCRSALACFGCAALALRI